MQAILITDTVSASAAGVAFRVSTDFSRFLMHIILTVAHVSFRAKVAIILYIDYKWNDAPCDAFAPQKLEHLCSKSINIVLFVYAVVNVNIVWQVLCDHMVRRLTNT